MPPENAVQDCCSPDIFIPVRLNERHDFFSGSLYLPERFPNGTLVIITDVFAGQKAFGPV